MSWFLGMLVGLCVGSIIGVVLLAWSVIDTLGSLDACRAAHPGYDCKPGWVVSKAFK